VHAAKGLEAPAVFVVNAGCLRIMRTPPWLIDWPAGAERPAQFVAAGGKGGRSPLEEELLQAQQAREGREDLNLLYVAVTRARQFLHLSGFRQVNQGERPSWHDHARQALQALGAGTAAPLAGVAEGTLHYGSGEAPAGAAPPPAAPPPADDPRLRAPIESAAATVSARPSAADADSDEAIDPQAARRGNAIHLLLQLLSENPQAGEAQLRQRLQARLAGSVADNEFNTWLDNARGLIATPALRRWFDPAQYVRAWNEVPYADGERGGVIDRLVDDGETLWILDYKTTPLTDPALLAERYRPQLQAYAAAVRRIWPGRALCAGLVLTGTRLWLELAR
jgi:ATP-dependent helicase/nuclease subunit A